MIAIAMCIASRALADPIDAPPADSAIDAPFDARPELIPTTPEKSPVPPVVAPVTPPVAPVVAPPTASIIDAQPPAPETTKAMIGLRGFSAGTGH